MQGAFFTLMKEVSMRFPLKIKEYQKKFTTVDSHTMGEATRIIVDGFPELPGKTMMERKKYVEEHYDHYRTALMLEPRGHRDMFGALLTAPVHQEADLGVIFMDSGGYLNMCGHGSIGTATVAVETGMVEVTEPYTDVVLDAPSGIIRTRVKVENKKAKEVSILNVPAFLYKEGVKVDVAGYGLLSVDIAFGGSFFALIDAEKAGLDITMENVEDITDLGMKLLHKINQTVPVKHPYLDITTVDLAEFYCKPVNPKATMKNVVIFGGAQADRSPCGTGTSAKLATLYAKGKIQLNEPFIYESITGSMFRGEAVKEIAIDKYKGIVPRITGSAHITGVNQWILDEDDPLEYGFMFGKKKEEPQVSDRHKIVCASWELFKEKGYEQTTVTDIIERAQISEEIFYHNFNSKEELQGTLADLFDEKYTELMLEMNPRLNHYEKLLYLNRELFQVIENQVPMELLSALYSSQMTEGGKNPLTDKNRFYYKLLDQIFEEGQDQGEFKKSESFRQMADTYAFLERGMICNWCIMDGRYSLTEYAKKMLPVYLKEFLR